MAPVTTIARTVDPVALGNTVERLAVLAVFGALVVAALAVQFANVRALYGGESAAEDGRVTCPSCGARTPAEA